MSPMTQTAFRLDETDYAILDEVKAKLGVSSRSDALRFVLRAYARQTGLAGLGSERPLVTDRWLHAQVGVVQQRVPKAGKAPRAGKPRKRKG